MSPLTTLMAGLRQGDAGWLDTTLADYQAIMARATTTTRYHRALDGCTFSASLYTAVGARSPADIRYLVRVERLT